MAVRSEDQRPTSVPPIVITAGALPIGSMTRLPANADCRARIFMGTNDVRVIALDARTGIPCADFGRGGEVRLDIGMKLEWPGEFQITSAPVVGRGVVVVGSAIADNRRVDAPVGRCAPSMHVPDARAGASIRCSMTASPPATPMSGRRCRRTRSAGWCSCRPPRRARISGAAGGPATTRTPIPWLRCASRPASWSGRSRPCTTTSGITICRRSRRWRASIPAKACATS